MKPILSAIFLPTGEFTRRLFRSGGISARRSPLLLAYYLQLLIGIPFAFIQTLIYQKRIANTRIDKAPVFILGHYRTGTTLLQKLLTTNSEFGFLTYYDALFPNSNLLFGARMKPFFQRLVRLVSLKNPFFNNQLLKLEEADEEDDYLMNMASPYSAYWGLVFPRKWREWLNCSPQLAIPEYKSGWKAAYLETIRYLTFKNSGKRLVLKSPPNTERIQVLLELFPNAKFVFIRRNPYRVYYSMRHMWKSTILRYYSLQRVSDAELDDIIFGHFSYLMNEFENQRGLIPNENRIEICYEELKAAPFETILQIYESLNLPGFEENAAHLTKQLEQEKSYRNFDYQLRQEDFDKINLNWKPYIDDWGYQSPTILPNQPKIQSKMNSHEHAKTNI